MEFAEDVRMAPLVSEDRVGRAQEERTMLSPQSGASSVMTGLKSLWRGERCNMVAFPERPSIPA